MAKKRKNYTENENINLLSQTNGLCPLDCDKPLMREKNGKKFKAYELAHIYPLNPSKEEIELLRGEERLSEDPNHSDNIIPLCNNCHDGFDNPRTVEEYRRLLRIKKELLRAEATRRLWQDYTLEKEINDLLDHLASDFDSNEKEEIELDFNIKEAEEKFDESLTSLERRRILNNITDFFIVVKMKLSNMDKESPGLPDSIAAQVKSFYKKLRKEGETKFHSYPALIEWIRNKTNSPSRESVEIVVSFFVQNCEALD